MHFNNIYSIPYSSYETLVVDPPWLYRNINTGGSMISGSSSKYPVLTNEQVKDLPIKHISKKDAILFLWITTPKKYEIATSGILEAWGFSYKTTVYWRKIMSLGMGFWFRGQVEECWLCIKGKVPSFRLQQPNIIQSKVRNHSQKPEEFWKLIEPIVKYPAIELFAREYRERWDSFGNEQIKPQPLSTTTY